MSFANPSKATRIVIFAAMFAIAFPAFFLMKWYRTTTSAEISATRGVYGMSDMEIWIDINSRMPDSLRLWACNTLIAREKEAMGGRNSYPPHSCQENFGTASAPVGDVNAQLMAGFASNSAEQAKNRGASTEQQAQVYDCVLTALTAAQIDVATADVAARQAAQEAIGQAFQQATADCMAKAGL